LSVQISLFGDGGYAIRVKLEHVVGDAQSLVIFGHMWVAKNLNLHHDTGSSLFLEPPIFDPKRLDDYASGDINGSGIDPHLAAVARALALHRYHCSEAATPYFPTFFAETLERTISP